MTRNALLILAISWAISATAWMWWTEYRIHGLETRLNLQEASQHWQEDPR